MGPKIITFEISSREKLTEEPDSPDDLETFHVFNWDVALDLRRPLLNTSNWLVILDIPIRQIGAH